MLNVEDTKEIIKAMKKSKKLRMYYNRQLANGWKEEEALMNTYDEYFYNKEKYC